LKPGEGLGDQKLSRSRGKVKNKKRKKRKRRKKIKKLRSWSVDNWEMEDGENTFCEFANF
jgi:hypothetical protein